MKNDTVRTGGRRGWCRTYIVVFNHSNSVVGGDHPLKRFAICGGYGTKRGGTSTKKTEEDRAFFEERKFENERLIKRIKC